MQDESFKPDTGGFLLHGTITDGDVAGRRGRARAACCALAAALLILCGAAAAQASPSDQSVAYQITPGHDGRMADAGLATPLAQAWAVTLPGATSYPLIVNGRVYVTAADRTLYALNQATGATVWSHGMGGTYGWSALAYDRGRVFTLNTDGLLTAFDAATGATAWSRSLPGQSSFSSAPTAADGVVYVGGAGSGGTLYAVRAGDGHVLWTRPVANGDQSSPALDADAVYVSYACHQDYAFARASGDLLWHNSGPCSGGGGRTPVRAGSVVLARDAAGVGAQVLAAANGAILGPLNAGPAPAVSGSVAFALSGSSLTAIAQTGLGVNLWTFTGDGGLVAAPLAVGGLVFAGSATGMLYALDAAAGTVAWSTAVGGSIAAPDEHNVSQPLTGMGAANGTLVVPAGSGLVAYRTASAITQAPGNLAPPTIDGTAQVGRQVAADIGIWSGLPSAYAYAWRRCDAVGASCADIVGASDATYKPVDADLGATLRVSVTATNAIGSSTPATSAASAVVTVAAPANQTAPAISGVAQQGATLTASSGTWSANPTGYAYRWRRCSPPPYPSCVDIDGAVSSTYVLTAADVGSQLVVRVTASNAGGPSDPADSAPTPTVSSTTPPPPPPPSGVPINALPPTFSGELRVGATLVAQPGTWSGSPTGYGYQWFSCDAELLSCPDIAGATKPSYAIAPTQTGRYLGIEIVATSASGDSQPADSDAFGPVRVPFPTNTAAPSIAGLAQSGQTLVADPGSWTASPTGFSYQWYRCNAAVTSCGPIAASTNTYTLGAADVGTRLGVGVVATNSGGYSDEALSNLTGVVLGPALAPIVTPIVTPPANGAFTIVTARARTDGRLVFGALVPVAGTVGATATATAKALAKGCRSSCSRTGRATYGKGSAKSAAAGTLIVTISPSARARAALRHSSAIRVRARLTFSPALGAAPSTQVRYLTVRRAAVERRASLRVAAARR